MNSNLHHAVPTDEEMRNLRLARGLRAVAATLVIGGIVLAALDTSHEAHSGRRDAADAIVDTATGVPLMGPTDTSPATGREDPALRQIDHAMENHG